MDELDVETVDEVARLVEAYRGMRKRMKAGRMSDQLKMWSGRMRPERESMMKSMRSWSKVKQYEMAALVQMCEKGEGAEDWEAAIVRAMAEIDDPVEYVGANMKFGETIRVKRFARPVR